MFYRFTSQERRVGPLAVLEGSERTVLRSESPGEHGVARGARQLSKLITGSVLKVYAGQPHGICITQKDRVNADLLEFLKSLPKAARAKTVSRQTAGVAG